ncbi:MAG: hypothetical protein ACFFG0_27750 [Candidatus Thorarchaeota archaeon]
MKSIIIFIIFSPIIAWYCWAITQIFAQLAYEERIRKSNKEFWARQHELYRRSNISGRYFECEHVKCDYCYGRTSGKKEDKNFITKDGKVCTNNFHKVCGCGCMECNPRAYSIQF